MADQSKDVIQLILDMGASGKNVDEVREALIQFEAKAKGTAATVDAVDLLLLRRGLRRADRNRA